MRLLLSFIFFISTLSISQAQDSQKVITTIRPLHAVATYLLQDIDQPYLLIEGVQSPHHFQLKPSHMKTLRQGQVIFYIDPRFETYLKKPLEQLPNTVNKVIISDIDGLNIHPRRSGGLWGKQCHKHGHECKGHHHDHHGHKHDDNHEKHHDHHDEDKHGHDHDKHHDDYNDKDEHEHGHDKHHDDLYEGSYEPDLHLWSDPENIIWIAKIMEYNVNSVYPLHTEKLEKNLQSFIQMMEKVKTQTSQDTAQVKENSFIVFHDAYQYYEKAFGFKAAGSITFEPGHPLSAKRISELKKKIQQNNVVCLFSEPQFPSKAVATLANDLNVNSEELDPIGSTIPVDNKFFETYFANMTNSMVKCLSK